MSREHKYSYQGDTITIKQLAKIKGFSIPYMRALIRQIGIDEAMAYERKPRVSAVKYYTYNGKKMTAKQLVEIAKVKCATGTMHLRIKKYGVAFSVENDDFEKLRRTGHLNRVAVKKRLPELPEYDPEKHLLENMVNSLQEQGMPLSDIYSEVRKRLAA